MNSGSGKYTTSVKGYVREVFTSIQGEGIEVGKRQTFVRFLGCNLSCHYCDTPLTQNMDGPFICNKKKYHNQIDVEFLLRTIHEPYVAITGGEPLMQIDFLKILLKQLKKRKHTLYLDTNATLPRALKEIVRYVDLFCLDFKIPSATRQTALWDVHRQCLAIASAKNVFVKIVITKNVRGRELEMVYHIIETVRPSIPLVIQPVFNERIPNIVEIQRTARARLSDVRIIPQVHKYLAVP